MSDNPKARGPRDPDRVDTSQDAECRYWSRKFRVSPEKIREAVKEVGPLAEHVERYLRDDAEIPRSA